MFRLFISLLFICLFSNSIIAQNIAATTGRLTTQQLSPEDAKLHKETAEVETFARKLSSLKTAFAEKDASKIVAYEAYILRAMRIEADQLTASTTEPTNARLEKMNATLAAFEGHAFDPAQPEAAAQDFAKLDEFLKIMQEVASNK
ncbi:MAG: hypothetical protein ACKVU0_12340 [Saprospiraceae bacterium]